MLLYTDLGRPKDITCPSLLLSLIKIIVFWSKFHWDVFPLVWLTISQFNSGHYLNQWCLFYWRIYASPHLNELIANHDIGTI